jgi:hypothetical protein
MHEADAPLELFDRFNLIYNEACDA